MNTIKSFVTGGLLLLIIGTSAAQATSVSVNDKATIRKIAFELIEAAKRYDPKPSIKRMPERLFVVTKTSRRKTLELLGQVMQQLKQHKVLILDFQISKPMRVYHCKLSTVVVLPTRTMMQVQGQAIKTHSYFIASRDHKQTRWYMISGAAVKRYPVLKDVYGCDGVAIRVPPILINNKVVN